MTATRTIKPISRINPLPEVKAGQLGMPSYTNAAVGQAVARCRREGIDLYRVTAVLRGNRFGYDLPCYDAENMARDLSWNHGYEEITFCKL